MTRAARKSGGKVGVQFKGQCRRLGVWRQVQLALSGQPKAIGLGVGMYHFDIFSPILTIKKASSLIKMWVSSYE